ncbi:flagellar export chaperone FliS [Nocardioides stalactiti]|uniref:flagellar export chaperone FliS n=1 Tax=Nocardioides stalactiti TaxID=2755356 RepID=UPI0016048052|nr:flagellar export chaperone FliS [Nocardioides stalactiti]
MSLSNARAAYVGNSVSTASPARLLVMLVERLELDVERALQAQTTQDWAEAHRNLLHAQEIVVELASSLKPELISGGNELAMLYEFLRVRLVMANIKRDPDITRQALTIARGVSEMWRLAALAAAV